MPNRACSNVPTFGNTRSGVVVPTQMRSMSAALTCAAAMARRAACSARSVVVSPSLATWRRSIPVRERIHSSLVSTNFSRSALVSTFSGRKLPVPAMREYIAILRSLTSGGQTLRDSFRYAVARFQYRDFDRALKCEQVGAAVTLDYDAVQSDHGGAIVSPRIHTSPQ